jgi:hypothetical protein
MPDVSPELNDPNRSRTLSSEDGNRLLEAAADLKQAIDDLAQEIVTGSAIGRAGARDRFDIALTEFSSLTDRTAE